MCLPNCCSLPPVPPQANRAHTYLGKRESEWHQSGNEADIYPNFVGMANSFGVPAARVIKKDAIRQAIRTMLDTPGPYLLEVMVPHIEHVLPMIPGGASFKEIIIEGDGNVSLQVHLVSQLPLPAGLASSRSQCSIARQMTTPSLQHATSAPLPRKQYLAVHEEGAVAVNVNHDAARPAVLAIKRTSSSQRRRQAKAHGAQAPAADPAARLLVGVPLRRPHLVLAYTRGDDGLALRLLAQHLRVSQAGKAKVASSSSPSCGDRGVGNRKSPHPNTDTQKVAGAGQLCSPHFNHGHLGCHCSSRAPPHERGR